MFYVLKFKFLKRLYSYIFICFWSTTSLIAREITDMAGRKVIIPDKITRVIPYDNKTNVLLYPIAQEKMIVKARAKVSPDLKYISKEYLRLPEADTRNLEEVIKLEPDFIVVGTFVDDKDGLDMYLHFAERVQKPIVFVDIELMHLDKSYAFLGELFQCKEKADRYVDFINDVYGMTKKMVTKENPSKVYLANMNDGLRTTPDKSSHAQLFDIMHLQNVSKVKMNSNGFANVSIEQIMVWDPEYIFCLGKGQSSPYRNILKSSLWKIISGVKNDNVFFIPAEPFPWFDMPPSVNRLAGMIWFLEVFYDQEPAVTRRKIIDFYKLFYGYELTTKEYEQLFLWQ